jgi:adenosylcobinamide-phosphate synthase
VSARAVGLLLGFVADRLLGDPQRFHPVAGFGNLAGALERRIYADSRVRGVAYASLLTGATVALGLGMECAARGPLARTLVTSAATWAVLGGCTLDREATAVHAFLASGDLPAARRQLTHLVGRDTSELDASGVSRAVIESIAENTSDAVVAPLVWGAVAGLPGLLGYRAANTLDAMVGHHNTRYERFGWATAGLDDLANLPGSRLSGLLTLAASPSRAGEAWRAWRRGAASHPSPNAGVVEASFAGALGVRLGGRNVYAAGSQRRVEDRGILGAGRGPDPEHIPRAVRLARRVGLGAAVAAVVVTSCVGRRRETGVRLLHRTLAQHP